VIATLAQDYAFGRDGVKAFKEAIKKAKLVHEEYLPHHTTDFTAGAAAHGRQAQGPAGPQGHLVVWAGAATRSRSPTGAAKRYGIEMATGGNILPAMASLQAVPRHGRRAVLLLRHPQEPGQRRLVANHYKQFKAPPDFFTAGGISAAMALVTALKKTNGDTNTNKLIKTMEGMSFDTPKGKMTFRKEDHQAMQSMYHFKIKVDPAFAWGVPELVREIKPEEMNVPIRNKR
jgi:branched-chain amino acid transport system substrate-binding protein